MIDAGFDIIEGVSILMYIFIIRLVDTAYLIIVHI